MGDDDIQTCPFDPREGQYKCPTVTRTTVKPTQGTLPPDTQPNLETLPNADTEIPITSTAAETHAGVTLTVAASSGVQATNAAATTTPIPSSVGGSDGLSNGAVAGIAIGTAIIGAAIAFAIAFLLFRRRDRPPPTLAKYESTPELVALAKGAPGPYMTTMSSVPPVNGAAAVAPAKRSLDLSNLSNSSDFLGGLLPLAADDTTVRHKVSALFGQIQLHVENFYRDVHASVTPSMEGELSRFGVGSMGMVELLQSASQPTVAIKHALVDYVLSMTSPDEKNLFPKAVVGVGATGKEQFTRAQDLSAGYILYRRLAVHLHSSTTSTAQYRQSDIREAAEHFSLTFFPWANPGYGDQEKDEDLVQIISNALDLMIWMYGQAFVYEFLWESVGRRGTVITPGLVKVTDAKGRNVQPQILLEPAVVSI